MRSPLTICVAAVLLFASSAWAQLSITSFTSPLVINFDSTLAGVENGAFAGKGFAPSPSTAGELDSNAWSLTPDANGGTTLAFGDTQTSSDFARGTSTGGVSNTAGGIYAFNTGTLAAPNWSLGIKPQGSSSSDVDFEPGHIILRILNSTTVPMDQFAIAYNVYVHNNQAGSSTVRFLSSSNNSSYTAITSLDVTTPASATSGGFVATSRSTTITGLNIAPGGFFYLEWNILNNGSDSNPRDEIALDDISVTAHAATTPAPEPALLLPMLFVGLSGLRGHRRRSNS